VNAFPESVNAMPKSVNAVPEGVNAFPESVNAMPKTVNAGPDPVNAFPKGVNAFPEGANANRRPALAGGWLEVGLPACETGLRSAQEAITWGVMGVVKEQIRCIKLRVRPGRRFRQKL
jgi:hypothetical protein